MKATDPRLIPILIGIIIGAIIPVVTSEEFQLLAFAILLTVWAVSEVTTFFIIRHLKGK